MIDGQDRLRRTTPHPPRPFSSDSREKVARDCYHMNNVCGFTTKLLKGSERFALMHKPEKYGRHREHTHSVNSRENGEIGAV